MHVLTVLQIRFVAMGRFAATIPKVWIEQIGPIEMHGIITTAMDLSSIGEKKKSDARYKWK